MAEDRGGHFEIQNESIKLQDTDCYHTNMLYRDNKLAKNMMTLCPPTGNEKLVWLMHYYKNKKNKNKNFIDPIRNTFKY